MRISHITAQFATCALTMASFYQFGLLGAELSETSVHEENSSNEMPLDLFRILKDLDDVMGGRDEGVSGIRPDVARHALSGLVATHKQVLLKAATSAQTVQRELAVRILPLSEDRSSVVQVLNQILVNDKDPQVRYAAAVSLGWLGDAESVKAFLSALEDQEEEIRLAAVSGLSRIGDEQAISPILKRLKEDENSAVRSSAADALIQLGAASKADELLDLMANEKDYAVRMAIAATVRALKSSSGPELPDFAKTLTSLSPLDRLIEGMRGVERKLRDDRHDQALQIQQKNVDDEISRLIKSVEEMERQCKDISNRNARARQTSSNSSQKGRQDRNQPHRPLADSSITISSSKSSIQDEAKVKWIQDVWAKLPPKTRDQMIQAFSAELPARWRKRLAAYYLSVAIDSEEKK